MAKRAKGRRTERGAWLERDARPGQGGRKKGASGSDPKSGHRKSRSRRGGDRKSVPPPRAWTVPWLVEWAKTLLFALVIFLILRSFLIESFVISSGSMEHTLLVGDFLLVNKTVFGSPVPFTSGRVPGYREPVRGEIIVFRADHAPGLDLVKRLAGVPGDTLSMRDGVLHLNGELRDEPYVVHDSSVPDAHHPDMNWQRSFLVEGVEAPSYRPTRDDWGPLIVPPERYFMLGDNREHSLDSRFWGFVERKKVKGKPFFVYYSYDKIALEPFRFITAVRLGRLGPFPP